MLQPLHHSVLGNQTRLAGLCIDDLFLKSLYLFEVCLFLFSRCLYTEFSAYQSTCKADYTYRLIFNQRSNCYSECRVCSPELVFIRNIYWER